MKISDQTKYRLVVFYSWAAAIALAWVAGSVLSTYDGSLDQTVILYALGCAMGVHCGAIHNNHKRGWPEPQ